MAQIPAPMNFQPPQFQQPQQQYQPQQQRRGGFGGGGRGGFQGGQQRQAASPSGQQVGVCPQCSSPIYPYTAATGNTYYKGQKGCACQYIKNQELQAFLSGGQGQAVQQAHPFLAQQPQAPPQQTQNTTTLDDFDNLMESKFEMFAQRIEKKIDAVLGTQKRKAPPSATTQPTPAAKKPKPAPPEEQQQEEDTTDEPDQS